MDTRDDLAEERGELIEDLIIIPLNNGNEEHMVKIGSNLGEEMRTQLINFLQKNMNVFAWAPADMPGIDAEVMEHYLTVDPEHRPMKKKFEVMRRKGRWQ